MKLTLALAGLAIFAVSVIWWSDSRKLAPKPAPPTRPPNIGTGTPPTDGPGGSREEPKTPEEMAAVAAKNELPPPPPFSVTDEEAEAYDKELFRIGRATKDPEKSEAIRRLRREYENSRRREIAKKRETEQEARRRKEIEDRKAEREAKRPPRPSREPGRPTPVPTPELPPPLEGVEDPTKKP